MTTTETLERPAPQTQAEDREPAHIILRPGGNAKADVTRAMVLGEPLTALCGRVWVPSRDTEGRPVCDPCKVELERVKGSDGNDG